MIWGGTETIAETRRIQSDRSVRMVGGSMTCMAMSRNGVRIGMVITTVMQQIRQDQHRAITVSCAAVAGSTSRVTAAPPSASGACPATASGATASAFLAPHCPSGCFAVRSAQQIWTARMRSGAIARAVARRPARSAGSRSESRQRERGRGVNFWQEYMAKIHSAASKRR